MIRQKSRKYEPPSPRSFRLKYPPLEPSLRIIDEGVDAVHKAQIALEVVESMAHVEHRVQPTDTARFANRPVYRIQGSPSGMQYGAVVIVTVNARDGSVNASYGIAGFRTQICIDLIEFSTATLNFMTNSF